jgi:tetratricopeptide (TPR) repeat protein
MNASKTGRNEPCPCGSGKKYKQCCADRPQSSQANPQAQQQQLAKALHVAHQYQQVGQSAQAEAICHQILQAIPNQADALHLLGVIALHGADIEAAVKYISKAIKVNSSNPEYYSNLGFALHEQGQLADALQNYRKALSIKPDYSGALYNLHALLLNPEDMAPSIHCIKRVVEMNPFDTDARFILGVLLDYSGDAEAAATHFATIEKSTNLFRARLDAWRYIKSANKKLPPITGSGQQTFRLGLAAANRDGLVLEFGVRNGTSIRQIAAMVDGEVHGFDSFEGLPEVWHHEPKGSYTTKGEIPTVPANVKFHVGWFEDTLPKFINEFSGPVRFMNIDCDIYSSTKTILDLLAPRIVPGTVMVFDEYIGNEHWREDEYKAFQEAVTKNGWSYEYLCFSVFTKQVAVRITQVS